MVVARAAAERDVGAVDADLVQIEAEIGRQSGHDRLQRAERVGPSGRRRIRERESFQAAAFGREPQRHGARSFLAGERLFEHLPFPAGDLVEPLLEAGSVDGERDAENQTGDRHSQRCPANYTERLGPAAGGGQRVAGQIESIEAEAPHGPRGRSVQPVQIEVAGRLVHVIGWPGHKGRASRAIRRSIGL